MQRQWLSIDYPGKFPERASRIRHYPFKDHHLVVFYLFLKLFIIILRKPLLVAILRLIEISFLPKNINISCASDDNSKYRLISKVRLRTLYKQSKFNKTQFVCPTDSFSLFPTEFLPDIVFKSNILYTPLRSKMKSAVRIPLGLGRINTQ